MNKLLYGLLMFAIVPLTGCDWPWEDNPIKPPAMDKVYRIELLVTPNASVLGWTAEVQYLGVSTGYMGRFNVNNQTRTVEWITEWPPSMDCQIRIGDVMGNEVAVFLVNDQRVIRTRDGISVTLNEQGWRPYSENIWHVQLDCRP